MSAQKLESLLARLYVDARTRAGFKADPRVQVTKAGLSEDERGLLEEIDWIGLELTVSSIARKRQQKQRRRWSALIRIRRVLLALFHFLSQ
jgi:hypothetical protein